MTHSELCCVPDLLSEQTHFDEVTDSIYTPELSHAELQDSIIDLSRLQSDKNNPANTDKHI